MSIRGSGWNGTAFNDTVNADSVQLEGYADENFSSTDDGGRFAIRTIQDGTNNTNDFRFVIDGRGNACIGNSCASASSNLTPSTTLEVYDGSTNQPGITHLLVREGGSQGTNEVFGVYAGNDATPRLVVQNGNVGIGTTTPYSPLTVWGTNTASTSAFLVANSASTTEFNVLDNGNATLAGNLIQNSDQRLKTNIQSLAASSSLTEIEQLNPVTFNWIDPEKGTGPQLGFIAQQVQQVFPNLVATTSPTVLTPNGTLSLDYIGLISPIVSAIQALSTELASIENTIAGFAQSFTTHLLSADSITANNQLCVGSTCVTPAQFQAMAAAANSQQSSQQGGADGTNTDASTTPDTPPVIQINGDNPAVVQVGDTYNDLGATITGPQEDLNLGIATYVNGIEMSPVQIDTSAAATDTIDYVATDQNGLTSTSTRTVIIEPAAAPSIVPTADASTTATTTTQ
jgi:hypothetical protein